MADHSGHHGHAHRHHGYSHARGHSHGREMGTTRLVLSILLNLLITIAEFIAGLVSGSLALLADAAHNLNDTTSLGISLFARRVSRREADQKRTFGYRRAEVIGAFVNLVTLVLIALFLLKEAVERYFNPRPIDGELMILVAGIALVANVGTALLLYKPSKGSLNIKSAFVHIVADALASVGVIVAGLLVIFYDFYLADPLLTALISGYILVQSYGMLRHTIDILMESAPEGLDLKELVTAVEHIEGVRDMHHVHVWRLDEERLALEAHLAIARPDLDEIERVKRTVKATLQRDFGIDHSTLEVEVEPCAHACVVAAGE